jgi:hypothetical protein
MHYQLLIEHAQVNYPAVDLTLKLQYLLSTFVVIIFKHRRSKGWALRVKIT